MSDNDDSSNLGGLVTWFAPWNYPSRPSAETIEAIAEQVLHGTSVVSAFMAAGVAPSRGRQWLRYGAEAYERDADQNDPDAPYLDLFLKVMQATGLASSDAQRRAHHFSPGWWLGHTPEHRSDWGSGASQTPPLLPDGVAGADERGVQPVTSLPVPQGSLRTVLRMMVETGAALLPVETEPEAKAPGEDGAEQVG